MKKIWLGTFFWFDLFLEARAEILTKDFIAFLVDFRPPKWHLEINWPLLVLISWLEIFTDQIYWCFLQSEIILLKTNLSKAHFLSKNRATSTDLNFGSKWASLRFGKVNSVLEACAKCFSTRILKFEILQTTWKNKTKGIKMLDLLMKNWKLSALFHFFHVICKNSNFNMWNAKHLAQASCIELTLQ